MVFLPLLLFAGAAAYWRLAPSVLALYAGASLVCFAMYALDKRAARRGGRRTRERTLLLAGLACGWPGGLLAQQWLRHKTAKRGYRTLFWCSALVNVGALAWLLRTG